MRTISVCRLNGTRSVWHRIGRDLTALNSSGVLLLLLSTTEAAGQAATPSGASPLPSESPPTSLPREAGANIDNELRLLQSRPGGLTAAKAAERAVQVNHEIEASQQREVAANAEIEAAKLRFAPRLTLSAGYTRYSAVDSPVLGMLVAAPNAQPGQVNPNPTVAIPFSLPSYQNQTVLRAGLTVPLTDYFLRFPQALEAAKSGEAASQRNREAQQARTATEAKIAFYSWTRAVLQEVTARQALRRATEHLTTTRVVWEAGAATEADYRAVEAQVAQAEVLATRAANNVAITSEQVRLQLLLPPGSQLEIGETIIEAPDLPRVPQFEDAWHEAQRARPELLALEETERQLRKQAEAQTATELPRVEALGEILYANPNPRYQPPLDEFKATWSVGVQAVWTVNDLPIGATQKKGIVAQAKAVSAQREALKEALRAEIMSASRAIEQASSTIESTRRGMVAAEAAYRVRRDQYLAERARNVELTDAETELTRARIDHIDALVDARIAATRLDYALGRAALRTRNH